MCIYFFLKYGLGNQSWILSLLFSPSQIFWTKYCGRLSHGIYTLGGGRELKIECVLGASNTHSYFFFLGIPLLIGPANRHVKVYCVCPKSPPFVQLVGQKPNSLFLKIWTKDTVMNQLVVGSAVSHDEPGVKRERWSQVREAEARKPKGQMRDHRASESQRRKFGFCNCSFYFPVASNLVPMITTLPMKSLALRSFSLC